MRNFLTSPNPDLPYGQSGHMPWGPWAEKGPSVFIFIFFFPKLHEVMIHSIIVLLFVKQMAGIYLSGQFYLLPAQLD